MASTQSSQNMTTDPTAPAVVVVSWEWLGGCSAPVLRSLLSPGLPHLHMPCGCGDPESGAPSDSDGLSSWFSLLRPLSSPGRHPLPQLPPHCLSRHHSPLPPQLSSMLVPVVYWGAGNHMPLNMVAQNSAWLVGLLFEYGLTSTKL